MISNGEFRPNVMSNTKSSSMFRADERFVDGNVGDKLIGASKLPSRLATTIHRLRYSSWVRIPSRTSRKSNRSRWITASVSWVCVHLTEPRSMTKLWGSAKKLALGCVNPAS